MAIILLTYIRAGASEKGVVTHRGQSFAVGKAKERGTCMSRLGKELLFSVPKLRLIGMRNLSGKVISALSRLLIRLNLWSTWVGDQAASRNLC
jgi:hypothetical protein